jgi:16S rRNA processing protein RimM
LAARVGLPHPLPDADAPAWPDDAVEVGRIIGAWGIKGALKVKAFSADPQALFSSRRWFVQQADGPTPKPGLARAPRTQLLRITDAREQGDHVVATAQDIGDRNAAEALTGYQVFIPRQSFPTPDADEFYWVDLIGLNVSNRAGTALGVVVGLIETGPHCVLRLSRRDADDQELMIPFVAAYVDAVDLKAKSIKVDWDFDLGGETASDAGVDV